MMSNMVEHMDGYYLRRILNRLVEKEKNQMLHERIPGDSKFVEECQLPNEASEGTLGCEPYQRSDTTDENQKSPGILQQLDPLALHVLYELVSLVQDTMSCDNQKQASTSKASFDPKGEKKQIVNDTSPPLDNDIISNILSVVDPLALRKILLGMVHHFPRTLEALILYMLSPKGAEVLTRKFDDMDQKTTKEEQSEFYRLFYGAFDDQFAAMDALLNGKELFAFQAFRNVLDKYLGVHLDQPNS